MAVILIFLLASFIGQSEGAVTASVEIKSTWNGGGQAQVVLKNSGPNAVCGVKFQVTLPSGTTISSSWNMNSAGNNQYTTPEWVNIPAGGQSTDPGLVFSGNGKPTVKVVSETPCGGGGGGGGGGGQTTATTKKPSGTTTTTTKAPGGGGGGGGGGATMTVTTDPSNAAINSCLKGNATGPIISRLNQPIQGGKFTFYGAGGTGACGQDSGKPGMSAAASGQLWNPSAQWVPPCKGTQYVIHDPICIGKCVKITYTCVGCSSSKTLIVPINNKCPECTADHVDLSVAAFNYLEPQGGTVGIAKNAVITYIDCP